MKALKWITDKEKAEYMRKMKDINLELALVNQNENQVWGVLGKGWTRQAVRGYRIHDFWNHELGCAIEVDGREHDRDYDNYRDEYNFRRSGVIVLRCRNKSQEDLDEVIRVVGVMDSLKDRKVKLGIAGDTKKARRVLSDLPYDKHNPLFLEFFVKEYNHNPYWNK
jgi:very-short-patch-repair endonuclease